MHIDFQTIQTTLSVFVKPVVSCFCFRKYVFLFALLLAYKTGSCQKNKAFYRQTKVIYGVASFYNRHMEGETTATGEVFHHNLLTAASNKFPLNTWVRITNLRNGKFVVVRINDRMSKSMEDLGRVVDMTQAAAKQLDFYKRGLARVKVEEFNKL